MNATRRVAVIGGNRIPFARSNSAYAHASNQEMLTAALQGLVDRFDLHGERLGDVAGGAVMKHAATSTWCASPCCPPPWRPRRRPSTCSRPAAPGSRPPSWWPTRSRWARSSAASPAASTPPPTPPSASTRGCAGSCSTRSRAKTRGAARGGPVADPPGHAVRAVAAEERRAAHRLLDGRARRADGARVGHQPRRPGRAGAREPPATWPRPTRTASSTT